MSSRAGLAAGLVVALTASIVGSPAGSFHVPGRPSVPLAKLFTPRHAPPGTYEVVLLDEPIDRARARVEAEALAGAGGRPPGASPVLEMDPLMAFGDAGTYEKTRVARLYTGRKAKVVRIPVERDGRTLAAVTLVSPYPDPALSRLVEGTMAIVVLIVSN